jgi:hypothetical protein
MKIGEYEFCYLGAIEPGQELVGNVQQFQIGERRNPMNRSSWDYSW